MKTQLGQAQLDQFRTALLEERISLSSSEKESVHLDDDRIELVTQRPSNRDEHSTAQSLPSEIAIEVHVLESIAMIDRALARIASKEYGLCIECGEPIPSERLLVFPAAARCLSCKVKFESKN